MCRRLNLDVVCSNPVLVPQQAAVLTQHSTFSLYIYISVWGRILTSLLLFTGPFEMGLAAVNVVSLRERSRETKLSLVERFCF